MARGGKRPGAGNKKGTTNKMIACTFRERFGDLMDKCTEEFLTHKDPKIRRRAWEVMTPYAYQRQPQVTEMSGLNGDPLKLELVYVDTPSQTDKDLPA